MAFFSNKRKDFSIQLPKQSIANGAFTVTDSANIDFTYALNNLTANLTTTGILAGTYGDATHIPILTLDSYGRVTGVTTVAIGGGGGTYTVNNGLTESPANNFQLGGTLIQNTTITESTYNLLFTATNKESLYLNSGYTTNNNLKPVLKLYRSVLGGVDGANNIGGSIEFKSSAAAGLISQPIVTDLILASVATNSDPQLTRETQFEAWVNYQNILTKVITSSRNLTRIDGIITELGATQYTDIESQFILSSYGLGAYTGTLAYTLGVDASGNVIEFTGGGGGITELTGDVTTPAASSGVTAATLKANLKTGSFGVTVDGVTSIIQIGQTGFVTMNYAGTISGWSISANAVGSIQFDIWKATGAIPTIANTIVAGVYPTLTAAQFVTSTTLTGWTLSFVAGDVFGFYVNSISTLKNATLTVRTIKS
jgi:hypothetical protein